MNCVERSIMRIWLSAVAAALAFSANASAQMPIGSYTAPTVNPRPAISPYLNLNRGGGTPAINYFGIVRPQIENQQAIQNLQHQVQTNQAMIQAQGQQQPATEEIAPTGRAMGGYLNYSHFFPLLNRGAGGTGNAKR